jgi:uncharacterized protein (TIGR04141 family)
MNLSVYLLKQTINQFEDALVDGKQRELIGHGQENEYSFQLYLIRGEGKVPDWVNLIRNSVEPVHIERVLNQAYSLLILVKVQTIAGERIFAIPFGHARFHIDVNAVEPKFGLITSLNSIDASKIKSVDSRILGTKTIQRREAANLDSNMSEFTFEFDSEILQTIEGVCIDVALGRRISGSDVLHIGTTVTFPELATKCLDLYTQYNQTSYRANFDFVDHIQAEKDLQVLDLLEQALETAIHARQNNSRISTAHPDLIEFGTCSYYIISGLGRLSQIADVSLGAIYTYLRNIQPTIKQIKDTIRIQGYDSNGDICTSKVPLLDFLIFEHQHQGRTYILSQRQWYMVEANYLIDLANRLNSYVTPYTGPGLLPWSQNDSEGQYNNSYRAQADYLVLDCNNFTMPGTQGHGKIEIADLFHLGTKRLICVKELNGSATLSHLFSQGVVSATLMKELDAYKQRFLQDVNGKWPGQLSVNDLVDLIFVFAVGTDRPGMPLDLLPFFSKVNLLRNAKRISRLGYRVEIAKVNRV